MRPFILVLLASAVVAFAPVMVNNRHETMLHATTRKDFLYHAAALTAVGLFNMPALAEEVTTLPNGVSYTVSKKGDGPVPMLGDLVALRFAAYCGDNKIDDIFGTPEPYYTRIGSGGLLKVRKRILYNSMAHENETRILLTRLTQGVEETIPLMRVGDRWVLSIPSNLAFGQKGRPASAGKPRIPGDATITFDVEMVGLPGKEAELIDLIGD
jgi:peptidylprolyl isomerase